MMNELQISFRGAFSLNHAEKQLQGEDFRFSLDHQMVWG